MFFPSKDPTYNTGKFGEIKELLLGMLDTYTYESVSRPVNFQSSNTCHQVSKQVDIPWWDWRLIPPYLVDSRLTQTNDTFEKPENMRWLSGMVAGLFKAAYLYSINQLDIQYEGIKYLKKKVLGLWDRLSVFNKCPRCSTIKVLIGTFENVDWFTPMGKVQLHLQSIDAVRMAKYEMIGAKYALLGWLSFIKCLLDGLYRLQTHTPVAVDPH